jgi:hypothetical protein
MNFTSFKTDRLYKHLMLPAALIAASLLMPATSQASLLLGTLNFNGNVVISTGLIHFTDAMGNPPGMVTVTPSTGSFAPDAGMSGVLKDITNSAFPIPTGDGSLPDFLTAPFIPLTTHFNMTFLFAGIEGTSGCGTGPNCTPLNSPYNLTNTSPATSTASFTVSGTEIDTLTGMSTTFTGIFTAQFTIPFQTLLATIAANQSVSTSFSGTIVTANPAPEVGSLPMLASGLLIIGLALGLRRYTDHQRN